MRTTMLACLAAIAASLPAQSFYIPTNTPSTGTNNVFPFGTSTMRYQALIRVTELNSTPALITGFGLAAGSTAVCSYGPVTMKMAHLASPTLSTTFDVNLAAGAVTTMDVPAFVWPVTASVWNDIDLQTPFVYNGVDNLVVEFLVTQGTLGTALKRDATNQRVYLGSYAGQLVGTNGGNTAFKMRVITGDATLARFGRGCAGSNSLTPNLTLTGSSQIGQTFTSDLSNALPNALCFVALGFSSALPFPIDLSVYGMTGCWAYVSAVATLLTIADGAGAASTSTTLPNDPGLVGLVIYSQYAPLDAGAPGGLTTSNYGRALVGN